MLWHEIVVKILTYPRTVLEEVPLIFRHPAPGYSRVVLVKGALPAGWGAGGEFPPRDQDAGRNSPAGKRVDPKRKELYNNKLVHHVPTDVGTVSQPVKDQA